jgi:16S rRNA U516 pseudouridylate synthase RsuA-like enzyme
MIIISLKVQPQKTVKTPDNTTVMEQNKNIDTEISQSINTKNMKAHAYITPNKRGGGRLSTKGPQNDKKVKIDVSKDIPDKMLAGSLGRLDISELLVTITTAVGELGLHTLALKMFVTRDKEASRTYRNIATPKI